MAHESDYGMLGGENNGWAVTQTTLFFERTGIGAGGSHKAFPNPGLPRAGCSGVTRETRPGTSRPSPSYHRELVAKRIGIGPGA